MKILNHNSKTQIKGEKVIKIQPFRDIGEASGVGPERHRQACRQTRYALHSMIVEVSELDS